MSELACLPTASATAPDDVRRVAAVPERRVAGDVSPAAALDGSSCSERRCLWCRSSLEVGDVRWCSKKCRQTAFRARLLFHVSAANDTPKRLKFADPPYPGMSRKYYRNEPTYAGEVDHAALVSSMEGCDGWALSTSAKTLQYVLSLCPPGVKIASWVKPHGVSSKTRGAHNAWEPIVYKPARFVEPGFPDWISTLPARGGGTLPGRKPLKYCAFIFRLLGASPVDELDDMFPGTGIVGRAFAEFKRASLGTRGGVAHAGASDVAPCSSRRARRSSTPASPGAAQQGLTGVNP